jgi:uncharacterized peroxidase-related enzyme
MEAHEDDLRSEIGTLEKADAVQNDYRSAGLEPAEVALLEYAVKLTESPRAMTESDVETLRAYGFTDEQIVDAVHCIAYFNFINRVLDGLGVDPESFMRYPHQARSEKESLR